MHTKKLFIVLLLSVSALFLFFALTVGAQQPAIADQSILMQDVIPILQGKVFEGPIGDESVPLAGVKVALYGAYNPYPDPGTLISVTYTNAAGWYGLPTTGNYEFYRIREFDPPFKVSVGATTVSGTVKTSNWIQYVVPLDRKILTGNKFWDKPRPLKWDKSVNSVVWTPGMVVTTETSDTIKVVDVIQGWPDTDLTLVEQWNPNHLKLIDWAVEPTSVSVIPGNDKLTTTLPESNQVYTVTKWFHVERCTWRETFLEERVLMGEVLLDEKLVTIHKTPPILWIDGTNNPSVYAGDVVSFILDYGNLGGYETGVMIRNTFPITAPYVHAEPMPDRQDPAGLWVEWDIGDLANGSTGVIEVVIAIDESLTPSTTLTIWDGIFNHVGDEVDAVELSFHVEPRPPDLVWEKWVNGIPYDPDWVVTVETSDTIQIVDVIITPPSDPAVLEELWDPAQLNLLEMTVEPDPGTSVIEPGRIEVTLPEGLQVFTITKKFHVEPCMWEVTFIEELLSKRGVPQPWIRTVPIHKIMPELWIDSVYDPDVVVGELASFELKYGNTGGRESFAFIRNEFPGIARFVDSVPLPDRVSLEGLWAEWDLGSLDMGQNASIQVMVRIAPDLPPSTTITIWDGIFNHADVMVDEVITRYHIPRPQVTFPEGDWPWYAQEEITVLPEPPIAGRPTELCAEVVNHDAINDYPVVLEFSVSRLGIGMPFYTVGAVEILVPSGGANRGCIMWIPPKPDKWCIQVRILAERYPYQISRRNLDVDEPLSPGVEHPRTFFVRNPFEEPVTITLGLVPHLNDWGLELSQDVMPNVPPGAEKPFTLTVTPPGGKALPLDGTPIVDIEAFVGENMLGGIRKIYRPPVPLHRFPDPVYAEREIKVHPYPPRAGEPTEICVELRNPTDQPQDVSVTFFWAKFGIGLPFTPINGVRNVHLPPHSIVKECIHWVPPVGGHICLQVGLEMVGHLPQFSQRNIDINEILQPGVPNTLVFPVGNPDTTEPLTVTLGLVPNLPGWGLELNPDTIPNLPPGETQLVSLTVTPPKGVKMPPDGTTIVDVEAFVDGELLGGIRKIYRPPVPIHRPKDPVYAESEIGIDPYPVLPGQPVKLSVEVHNPTNQDQIVTATFAIADFGIGLPFSTMHIVPNPVPIFVPAHGAARAYTKWTPPNHWGKFCVQVTLEIPGHEPIWSRRNIDVGEPLRPGVPHSLEFQVGGWPFTEPVTIELGFVNHKPGWEVSLSDTVLTGVSQSQPVTVTLTVKPAMDAKLGTGMPIVDVEAYVDNELIGGFRKMDIPPIPIHKPHERTYAESEISIVPYPLKQGVQSLVSTVLQNATVNTTTVNLEFGWANFGIGIPFTSTGMAPPTRTVELGPLMAVTSTVMWTPSMSGHQCVLVKLNDADGIYEEQWSQRNVDVERTPPCGTTQEFTFTVYNDSPFKVSVDVGMIIFNVPADWTVTVSPTGTIQIAKFSQAVITVTVSIPCPPTLNYLSARQDIAAIQAFAGSVPTIDVEAYEQGELVGGIEIRFDDSIGPDLGTLYLPLVLRNP